MKKLILLLAALSALLALRAEEPAALRFRADGTFKIMQLTDLHYNGQESWQSEHLPALLLRMIRAEQPDLIVLTGDVIYRRPGEALLASICGSIASAGVPYAVTPGNHDAEQGVTQAELHALYRTLPGCVNVRYDASADLPGDFVIPVLSHADGSEQARLYVMDSNDYNEDGTYKGFTADQVDWYRARCAEAAARNGRPVNALIFFHVPLPEYVEAYRDGYVCGARLENECPSRDNAGMFRAIVEGGEAKGVFVGHDHSNNYVAQKEGIALVYGQYSGGYAEYQELATGVRMIELREGRPGFTTWVRFPNGRQKYRTEFPLPE